MSLITFATRVVSRAGQGGRRGAYAVETRWAASVCAAISER